MKVGQVQMDAVFLSKIRKRRIDLEEKKSPNAQLLESRVKLHNSAVTGYFV